MTLFNSHMRYFDEIGELSRTDLESWGVGCLHICFFIVSIRCELSAYVNYSVDQMFFFSVVSLLKMRASYAASRLMSHVVLLIRQICSPAVGREAVNL